jgi:hypothetical protein
MFVVNEAVAAAIRDIFHERGELAAAAELRRLFPGITDAEQARESARTIAGWRPLAGKPTTWARSDRPLRWLFSLPVIAVDAALASSPLADRWPPAPALASISCSRWSVSHELTEAT